MLLYIIIPLKEAMEIMIMAAFFTICVYFCACACKSYLGECLFLVL